MEKQILSEIIDEVFQPLGFKRKGLKWLFDNGSVIKIVVLGKYSFGDVYFVDYGLIVKAIPLDDLEMHVHNRAPEFEDVVKFRLNLMSVEKTYFADIHSEDDVLSALKKLHSHDMVPLVVKEYFGIGDDS